MKLVRAVSDFMRFYPRYTCREVLNEYAITFYGLLNEAYRSQARNYQILATISELPHMDKSPRAEFHQQLDWAGKEAGDILSSSGRDSTDDEIKRALGG